jgi:hypothetical protein
MQFIRLHGSILRFAMQHKAALAVSGQNVTASRAKLSFSLKSLAASAKEALR